MIDTESEPGAWQRELDQRPKVDVHKWAERNVELHIWVRKLQKIIRELAPEHPVLHEIDKMLSDVPQEKRSEHE